jgi:hypothetical protein
LSGNGPFRLNPEDGVDQKVAQKICTWMVTDYSHLWQKYFQIPTPSQFSKRHD